MKSRLVIKIVASSLIRKGRFVTISENIHEYTKINDQYISIFVRFWKIRNIIQSNILMNDDFGDTSRFQKQKNKTFCWTKENREKYFWRYHNYKSIKNKSYFLHFRVTVSLRWSIAIVFRFFWKICSLMWFVIIWEIDFWFFIVLPTNISFMNSRVVYDQHNLKNINTIRLYRSG